MTAFRPDFFKESLASAVFKLTQILKLLLVMIVKAMK